MVKTKKMDYIDILENEAFFLNLRINILKDYLKYKFNYSQKDIDGIFSVDISDLTINKKMANKIKSFTINISEMRKSQASEIICTLKLYKNNKAVLDEIIKRESAKPVLGDIELEFESQKINNKKNIYLLKLISDKYAKNDKEKKVLDIIAKRIEKSLSFKIDS